LKRFYRYLSLFFSILSHCIKGDNYLEGSWYGNDTIWRTILDLNKIILFTDKSGELHSTPQRKMIIITDMIIAGEGEGPLTPSPKYVGAIIVGNNPVCIDKAICSCMGFDWQTIPTIVNAQKLFGNDCKIKLNKIGNVLLTDLINLSIANIGKFIPTKGWERVLK
jgi:hypothetical protein